MVYENTGIGEYIVDPLLHLGHLLVRDIDYSFLYFSPTYFLLTPYLHYLEIFISLKILNPKICK